MNAQTELHLAWIDRRYTPSRASDTRQRAHGRLVGDDAPGLRAVDIQSRILGLKMVQDVRNLNDERRPKPLCRANFLGDRRVERPGAQSAKDAGSAASRVQTQDRTPEQGVCCGRIAEYVQSRSARGGVTVHSHSCGTGDIVVHGITPSVRRRQNGVLIRTIVVSVDLAEGLSVGIAARADVYLKRSAALRREQR